MNLPCQLFLFPFRGAHFYLQLAMCSRTNHTLAAYKKCCSNAQWLDTKTLGNSYPAADTSKTNWRCPRCRIEEKKLPCGNELSKFGCKLKFKFSKLPSSTQNLPCRNAYSYHRCRCCRLLCPERQVSYMLCLRWSAVGKISDQVVVYHPCRG